MPNVLPTKYRIRIALYRTKVFLRSVFLGKERGAPKKSRIFSVLFSFIVVAFLASLSIYGFNLRGIAQDGITRISSGDNVINNTYSYSYKGVSIHTKAENISTDLSYQNTATVRKGADPAHQVKFTLTITNNDATKPVDVKFTLPSGFTYDSMVSPATAPKKDSCTGVDMTNVDPNNKGVMYWCGYSAISGESTIIFKTTAP